MSNIANNRIIEIQTLLTELNQTLKMSVNKAIRIGQLLSEQKKEMQHGDFLPWLESNFEMSERTAQNYMRLFYYRDKTAKVADLQEAYQKIEYIEKKEKAEQQKKDDELIKQRIQTGEKPEGWTRSHEYQYKKRIDDKSYQERKTKIFDEKKKENQKDERLNNTINLFIKDNSEKLAVKEKLKLNTRTDNNSQEAILEIIDEYLNSITETSRRIETAQNIIKYLRTIVVNLQKRGA